MNTLEIKKIVKEITGFNRIFVRKGTGTMKEYIGVYADLNNNFSPFVEELRRHFTLEFISGSDLQIKI